MEGQQSTADPDRIDIGDLMASIRANRKLSPAELARHAGVDVKTVRNLENGSRWPQDVTRAKLERALGVTPGLIREMLDAPESRSRLWDALRNGQLSVWPAMSDGEVNSDQFEPLQASVGDASQDRRTDSQASTTTLELSDAAEYAGAVADLLHRVSVAATEMDDHTRNLLTTAQTRTVAFLYTLVAGADEVDVAVDRAISTAARLGDDAPFRDGVRTALDVIAQLRRRYQLKLTGSESVNEGPAPSRNSIDVTVPGGRGHVFLKFVGDEGTQIELNDIPASS